MDVKIVANQGLPQTKITQKPESLVGEGKVNPLPEVNVQKHHIIPKEPILDLAEFRSKQFQAALQENEKILSNYYNHSGSYFKQIEQWGAAKDSYYIAYSYDPTRLTNINEIKQVNLRI
jgi:hypothetical protein